MAALHPTVDLMPLKPNDRFVAFFVFSVTLIAMKFSTEFSLTDY
jgi:hypothetical protein